MHQKVKKNTSHRVKETHPYLEPYKLSRLQDEQLHLQLAIESKSINSLNTCDRSIQSPRLKTPPIPNFTPLVFPHPHNKVVVSKKSPEYYSTASPGRYRVLLPPPLQADVEYCSTASPGRQPSMVPSL
ncbi:hypothetical protein QL285_023091 [Trifolium repens]|nr:hypothetical protein QL285_023091 [Trifolium repens]